MELKMILHYIINLKMRRRWTGHMVKVEMSKPKDETIEIMVRQVSK